MKLKLSYFLVPLLLLAGYFMVGHTFPKYSGQYLFFIVLILADIYLWTAVKKQVFNHSCWLKGVVVGLYWLPLALLATSLILSQFITITDWRNSLRTWVTGIIMIGYTAKILPVVFLILADVVRVTQKLFVLSHKEKRQAALVQQKEGITRSKFLQYIGFIGGGLVLGTMFTGMLKWAYEFRIIREKVKIKALPVDLEGFRIVQISDIHLGSWTSQKPLQQAVDLINELKADLVLFTGDLVNFATREAFGTEDIMKQIKARHGVFAVLGNHDYGNYISWPDEASKQENMLELERYYKQTGWQLLNNENRIIRVGDTELALVGVENWGANPRFPQRGDIELALRGTENSSVRVLMTHDPSHWEKVIIPGQYPIDLSLSGHTHGFQFGIETSKVKWSPAQYLYRYWAGLYQDASSGHYLYVNRGLGSIGYPGRIGMPPEITELTLTAG